ncbi:sensor histidine kinase [Pontibacter ruber]|uniref:Sensor histidine kinase n=1 Tax=Pontibacter ruber TaxID=1343895 RepID=A0ABW5D1E8_9BACT|nr:histidine kinase [Pontibacter ruber]
MRSKYYPFLRLIGIAAITTVLLYYALVYVHNGTIWLFNRGVLAELAFAFFFLLALFWSHTLISKFFTSSSLANLPRTFKAILEGVTVILTSVLICYLLYYLPYVYIYELANVQLDLLPTRVRLAYVISSIASLFFYYFVERERNIKQLQAEHLRAEQLQKENFRAQLESLKNQVNPHFLFNSLNVLGSLIYKNQDQAVQFLGQLSEVYRTLLDSGQQQLVPLQKELELANAYIYLMKTRFGDNVQFEVEVPQDKLQLQLPPTSVQLLIENAIKHNGSTSKKPLVVKIYTSGNKLVVENNLQPRLSEVTSTGLGLQNISNRYKYMSDEQVEINQNDSAFTVKLPLLSTDEV